MGFGICGFASEWVKDIIFDKGIDMLRVHWTAVLRTSSCYFNRKVDSKDIARNHKIIRRFAAREKASALPPLHNWSCFGALDIEQISPAGGKQLKQQRTRISVRC